jgi:hypothetical protein
MNDINKGRNATLDEMAEARNMPAVYATNFVMCIRDGALRIAFLDDMHGAGYPVGRMAVAMPVITALAMYNTLGKLILESAGKTPEIKDN